MLELTSRGLYGTVSIFDQPQSAMLGRCFVMAERERLSLSIAYVTLNLWLKTVQKGSYGVAHSSPSISHLLQCPYNYLTDLQDA